MTLASPPAAEIHAALDHAPIGAMIVDHSGVVSWANTAAAGILGEPTPTTLCHFALNDRLSQDSADALSQLLDQHFRTKADARTGWTRSFDLVGQDGAFQTAELTLAPMPGEQDPQALLYVQSLTRQVTAERRFAQIFETLPLGLIVVDDRQRIVQANASLSSIFGHAVGDLIGQPLEMLLPDRYRESHGQHFAGYAAAPTSRMMGSGRDLTGLHRSGTEIPVEIALTRLENAGQPLFLAIVTDISGRKRAESALQQTNAQLEEFTYVASHDLRSPLRGIGDLASWIREDLGEDSLPPDVRHNFDRIALRISRAEQMIDDLLTYARAGIRDPQMESVDPSELIDAAIAMAMVPDGFAIETRIAASALTAPRAPLFTSLRNLIANAAKHHGGDTGRIHISMHEEGRFSVFTVDDDGKGITPGSEERIFKLFYRASPDTKGDGVGLAFSRRMINAHGGMITVEGQGPLGGARFQVHWPRILLREFDNE